MVEHLEGIVDSMDFEDTPYHSNFGRILGDLFSQFSHQQSTREGEGAWQCTLHYWLQIDLGKPYQYSEHL